MDTSGIQLPPKLQRLVEELAAHVHERWMEQRIREGWSYGPTRDDSEKITPFLVPYSELPDAEREVDRVTASETLKAIIALGGSVVFDGTPD